jgi:hypothetical protein
MIKSVQFSNIQRRRFAGFFEVKLDGSCETIGELKKRIFLQKNLAVVALLYRGVELKDERRLDNFLPDVRMGPPRFSVHTRIRPRATPGGVSLNVLNLNRQTFQVHFPSLDSTVRELREKVGGYEDMSIDMVALTYEGRQLNADESTLRECRLEPGCNVLLVGRLRGGCGAPEVQVKTEILEPKQEWMDFVDVENTDAIEKIPLNRNAPDWRVSKRGLNVEGLCRNKACIAFNKMVVCNLRFTAFSLGEEVHCPLCNAIFKAETCGFRKCEWMFEGRKKGMGSVDVMSQWMVAGKDYERFNEASGRDAAQWESLVITAKAQREDGNQCEICCARLSSEDLTSFLPLHQCGGVCGHAFHQKCVTDWQLLGNTTCPTCRDPLRHT